MTERLCTVPTTLPAISSRANRREAAIEWLSSDIDSCEIGYRVWYGQKDAPVAIYLHGIEGHSQWFENTASFLNENGITIYALDRRGSGMNTGKRGHIDDYKILLKDLEAQLDFVHKRHEKQSLFLIANCWAAKLAVIYAQKNYRSVGSKPITPISGLILIAPALYTQVDLPFLTKCKIALGLVQGGESKLKYWPIPLTTSMLTKNQDFFQYLENDSLRLTEATSSFFAQTFFLTLQAQKSAPLIDAPVLLLQGETDEIVNTKKITNWFEQLSSHDKVLHNFSGGDHSLDFDPSSFEKYVQVISKWIMARGKSQL